MHVIEDTLYEESHATTAMCLGTIIITNKRSRTRQTLKQTYSLQSLWQLIQNIIKAATYSVSAGSLHRCRQTEIRHFRYLTWSSMRLSVFVYMSRLYCIATPHYTISVLKPVSAWI